MLHVIEKRDEKNRERSEYQGLSWTLQFQQYSEKGKDAQVFQVDESQEMQELAISAHKTLLQAFLTPLSSVISGCWALLVPNTQLNLHQTLDVVLNMLSYVMLSCLNI